MQSWDLHWYVSTDNRGHLWDYGPKILALLKMFSVSHHGSHVGWMQFLPCTRTEKEGPWKDSGGSAKGRAEKTFPTYQTSHNSPIEPISLTFLYVSAIASVDVQAHGASLLQKSKIWFPILWAHATVGDLCPLVGHLHQFPFGIGPHPVTAFTSPSHTGCSSCPPDTKDPLWTSEGAHLFCQLALTILLTPW